MNNWKESLKNALLPPLPGAKAQEIMAPSLRYTGDGEPDSANAKQSSVLVLLYPGQNGLYIPFIQRPNYIGAHGGQISFPGGKCEQCDTNSWETALRETREELGIETDQVEFIGELSPLYIPNSNYVVYPQVGYLSSRPVFIPNAFEVSEVIEVSIKTLYLPSNVKQLTLSHQGKVINAPYFDAGGRQIWGATAMMLSELICAFKQKAPRWANALHFCSAHTFQESL